MTCEKSERLSSAQMDARLSPLEWIGLRVHLLMCRNCQVFVKFLRELKDAVFQHGRNEEEQENACMPEEACCRILRTLNQKQPSGGAGR